MTPPSQTPGISETVATADRDCGLGPVDWTALLREFHRRRIDGVYNAVVDSAVIPGLDAADEATETEQICKPDRITRKLVEEETWIEAFKKPGRTTLLAYFLFVWGMWKWERTSDYDAIAETVAHAARAYRRAKGHVTELAAANIEHEESIVTILVDQLTTPAAMQQASSSPPTTGALLLDCMNVEVALNNSSAKALRKRSQAVAQRARDLLESEEVKSDGSPGGIHRLLREVLCLHRDYYSTIADVADAFLAAGPDAATTPPQLDAAIKKLESCQVSLAGDVCASELCTHRHALRALGERLKDPSFTQLTFRSVKFVYIYPFTIQGPPGKAVSAAVGKFRNESRDQPGEEFRLAGLIPMTAREVPFTDLWTWGGPFESAAGGSVGLPLPPLSVQIPDEDESPLGGYDVEVRFNNLGNHYLRIEKTVPDPTFTQITQGLRRASWAIGRETVTSTDGGPWHSLVDYAGAVVDGLPEWLCTLDGLRELPEEAKPAVGTDNVIDLDRDHHTLVEVRAASVKHPGGGYRDATGEEVRRMAQRLLVQPVNPVATTLHEWMCIERTDSTANMLDYQSFMSDFVIGTGPETVLCMLSSPDWLHAGYSEVVEFVASLPALLRCWMHQLDEKIDEANARLSDDRIETAAGAERRQREEALAESRRCLHEKAEEIRRDRMYLNPSELLGSVSWGSEKGLLAKLYALPTITDMATYIEGRLARADVAIERIVARELRLHDDRIRRYEDVVQWTLFFVSLFSFAGVVALFLQLIYGPDVPGFNHGEPRADFIVVSALYVLIFVLALVGAMYMGRKFRGRRR